MTPARTLVIVVGWACASPAPSISIFTDGRFEDWASIPFIGTDARDAPAGATVDLLRFAVADDPAFLHLRIDVGRAVNAQAMRGLVAIILDADGQAGTGGRVGAIDGADVVVELSRQDAPRAGGFGLGIGYRSIDASGVSPVRSGYDLDLIVAPTFSASEFEIRIARGVAPAGGGSVLTGPNVSVQIAHVVEMDTLDVTPVARHRLTTPFQPRGMPSAGVPAKAAGTVRVLQWNVGETQLRDQMPAFARVIRAAEPDVVLLDEVFRDVRRSDIDELLERAAPDPALWNAVIGRSGGRQKNVVMSRFPLRPEPLLADFRYEGRDLDSLTYVIGETEFGGLAAIERASGMAAVGAWASAGDRDILFLSVDLQSAGYDGSPRDRLRELQARTLRRHIDDALASHAAQEQTVPMVIGGDLNLVGSPRPLEMLTRSFPRAGVLVAAEPYRLGDRTQVTWRDPRDAFTPGRLDYVLYTPSTLRVRQSFVFDVAALADSVMAALGVRRDDALVWTSHLPVVVDLEVGAP